MQFARFKNILPDKTESNGNIKIGERAYSLSCEGPTKVNRISTNKDFHVKKVTSLSFMPDRR